ncbi:response regulator transcription factor [Kordia sp.]|uniref:response regulator transcription factor n=1 Tax=Kordia sp. TaxID=1965332 RepID=UPI003D6BCAAB
MRKPTILVVEDEALIAMHIKTILEQQSYNVCTCNSIEKAIICVETQFISLILIDINLNTKKDGVDLGKYLLEKDSVPYLYITSYTNKTVLDRVNETRPYGYIVKPFKEVDITSTVSIILNNYKHREIDSNRSENATEDHIPYRLREVISYINENIHEKLKIEELASKTTWKRHHFMKLFTKYLHVSPYQYILSRKIEKSKVLLAETNIPINEIAFELGFNSYSNFCNAFKKNSNITAKDYRNRQNPI